MSDKQKNISDQSFSENRTTGAGADKTDSTGTDKGTKRPAPMRGPRNLKPIIMSLILFLGLGSHRLQAQLETTVSLTGTYSDNVFQLSEHDLQRFDQGHQNLSFVNTSDDLSLALKADLAWPLRYKWWKFTPSVTGTISQNISTHPNSGVMSFCGCEPTATIGTLRRRMAIILELCAGLCG